MPKETATQRRAREAAEVRARTEKWEAEKLSRLLHALARAYSLNYLGVEAAVTHRYNNVLYYSFKFPAIADGNRAYPEIYCDPVEELSEYVMTLIENDLLELDLRRVKEQRLNQVRQELLARLSDEEREALGF